MTGEELKGVQRASGLSDKAFLEWMAINVTSAARRRLRRWKLGELPVPDNIALYLEKYFAEELASVRKPSVDRDA